MMAQDIHMILRSVKGDNAMIIVYESKTGFTKRYADMLAEATALRAYSTKELGHIPEEEEIIFLGWIKAGRIQGLKKVNHKSLRVVCGSGSAEKAESDEQTMMANNHIENLPFFYLRGGCKPLKELRGMDKILLSFFVRMLEKRTDEKSKEAVVRIRNGFDGVNAADLDAVIEQVKKESVAAENPKLG